MSVLRTVDNDRTDNAEAGRRGLKRPLLVTTGLFCMLLLHSGCAQILVPGTLAGAGELYRYSTGNVAQKTLVGSMGQVVSAAEIALKKMEIDLIGVDRTGKEVRLHARARELEIEIRLEQVTAAAIRAKVDAVKDHVVKDKATASEILSQIKVSLEGVKVVLGARTRVFVKNRCGRPIRVVVYYRPDVQTESTWQTRGWYFLDPEKREHAADTGNRFIYFYAESTAGRDYHWAGENFQPFKGVRYGFFEVDLGDRPADFTQTFNCSP